MKNKIKEEFSKYKIKTNSSQILEKFEKSKIKNKFFVKKLFISLSSCTVAVVIGLVVVFQVLLNNHQTNPTYNLD